MELVIVILGGVIAIINALIFFTLNAIKNDQKEIKADQKDIWKRLYNHYHEIKCNNKDCTALKTGNVIIPHSEG